MSSNLVKYKELSELTGRSVGALRVAMHAGRIPVTASWEEGNRVFNRQEVEAWIEAGMPTTFKHEPKEQA